MEMTWDMQLEVRKAALDAAVAGPRKRKPSRTHAPAPDSEGTAFPASFAALLAFFLPMEADRITQCCM